MERENSCSWEEKIYWGHFSTIHFAQFLLADFEDHLDIPAKFSSNLKHKLPGNVTLRGPSGVTWNMEVVGDDDTLAFKSGWNQFVLDNSLVENDFLIFKYNGESLFDVLMFDAQSLCEKEATYFVRATKTSERQTEGRKETSNEVVLNSSSDGNGDNDFTTPTEQNSPIQLIEKEVTMKEPCASMSARRGSRIRRPSRGLVLSKRDDVDAKRSKGSAKQYVSKRRPITEEEKKKALEAAKSAANEESAVVVMRPSSVYSKFYVVIPSNWVHKHLRLENQDVILRHESKTWDARFNYVKDRSSGGIATGWKNFVVDNELEEYDVCVFEVAPGTNVPIMLDVTIFRVLQDTTPRIQLY